MLPILSHCPEIPIIPLQHTEHRVTISLTAEKAAECSTKTVDATILQFGLAL